MRDNRRHAPKPHFVAVAMVFARVEIEGISKEFAKL